MNEIKIKTRKEMLIELQSIAKTLTQEQVTACAWRMGAGGAGWTPENLAANYQPYIDAETE